MNWIIVASLIISGLAIACAALTIHYNRVAMRHMERAAELRAERLRLASRSRPDETAGWARR